jgi:hypothetical protein
LKGRAQGHLPLLVYVLATAARSSLRKGVAGIAEHQFVAIPGFSPVLGFSKYM